MAGQYFTGFVKKKVQVQIKVDLTYFCFKNAQIRRKIFKCVDCVMAALPVLRFLLANQLFLIEFPTDNANHVSLTTLE